MEVPKERLLVRLVITPNPDAPEFELFTQRSKYVLYVDENITEFELPPPLQIPDNPNHWMLSEIIMGVFCISSSTINSGLRMVLVNPATGEFKRMPTISSILIAGCRFWTGCGINPATGCVKIVLIVSRWQRNCRVYVCSVTDDRWHLVDTVASDFSIRKSYGNTYLKGAYYWALFETRSQSVQVGKFDMETNLFSVRDVSGCYVGADKRVSLSLCGDDELNLLVHDTSDDTIVIWRMAADGAWSRKQTVGPLHGLYQVLFFWRNNELLIETKTTDESDPGVTRMVYHLNVFDVLKGTKKLIQAHEACVSFEEEIIDHSVFTYKESSLLLGDAEMWTPADHHFEEFLNYNKVPVEPLVIELSLVRCAAKMLMAWKTCSKELRNMIENQFFVQEYYGRMKERLLVRLDISIPIPNPDPDASFGMFTSRSKYALYVDENITECELPPLLQIPDNPEHWVLSEIFMGVFCIHSQPRRWSVPRMVLVNPATRAFKEMPTIPISLAMSEISFVSGCGVNLATGHLKLVLLEISHLRGVTTTRVHVCSVTDDSWRTLPVFKVESHLVFKKSYANTYLKGSYYWAVLDGTPSGRVLVCKFDFETEQFSMVQVPDCYHGDYDCPSPHGGGALVWGTQRHVSLSLCGDDELNLLVHNDGDKTIDIWRMAADGGWGRKLTVGPLDGLREVLFFWRNNELVINIAKAEEVPGRVWERMVEDLYVIDVHEGTRVMETAKLIEPEVELASGESGESDGESDESDYSFNSLFTYREGILHLPGAEIWTPADDRFKELFTHMG